VQQSIWIPARVFKEGTKTTNTDVSPAGSKNQKQVEMEGHRYFIQECAVEDVEWKWSPVYLLAQRFFWQFCICALSLEAHYGIWFRSSFKPNSLSLKRSSIVVASQYTRKLHFSEKITDVDLNRLSQQLEHVSQEKVFGSNLSLVQDLIRSQLDDMWMDSWRDLVWEEMSEPSLRKSWEEKICANDIACFKAPLKTPGHQEVLKRVCNHTWL
jgi:hypothetical protein